MNNESENIQVCPTCGASCNNDVTIEDHGECIDCHHARLNGELDTPQCEQCGEADADLSTSDAGLCVDCFADDVREILSPVMGYEVCAFPLRQESGFAACLVKRGVEHSHDIIKNS